MNVPDSLRAGMQQTNALFESEVVRKRDIDVLDQVYTADARILPPGAELIEGRAAIKDFWRQAIASLGVTDARLTTVDAEVCGDTVVEVGRAELTLGEGHTVAVKYVVHWKEEDGAWKWRTDIWNLNQ